MTGPLLLIGAMLWVMVIGGYEIWKIDQEPIDWDKIARDKDGNYLLFPPEGERQ